MGHKKYKYKIGDLVSYKLPFGTGVKGEVIEVKEMGEIALFCVSFGVAPYRIVPDSWKMREDSKYNHLNE